MSFNKKLISVLLIALALIATLTGCKKSTPAEEAAAEIEAAVDEASAELEEAAEEAAYEAEAALDEASAAAEDAAAELEAAAEDAAYEAEAAVDEAAYAAEETVNEISDAAEETAYEIEAAAEDAAYEAEAAVDEATSAVEETVDEISDAVENTTAEDVVEAVSDAIEEAEAEAAVEEAETEAAVEALVDEVEEAAAAAEVEEAVDEAETEAAVEDAVDEAETEAAVEEAAEEVEAEAAVEEAVDAAAAADTVVASVDGNPITLAQVQELAVFNRYQYIGQYQQYAQMYQMYGLPLDTLNEQVESQLGEDGKEAFADEVIDQLVYNKILESEAEKQGIVIEDAAITARLKEMFGYTDPVDDGSGQPLGLESYDFEPSDLEDDDDRLAEFKAYVQYVSEMGYNGSLSYDFLYDYAKHILLEDALFNKAIEGRVFEAEMVNANHILVETEEQAKDLIDQLNNGADWAELAAANSLDTSNKDNSGALGWFARGQMVEEFENAAFALEPGEISEPIHTNYGYHIIQSLGKENRELTDDALTAAQNEAYSEWATEIRRQHEIELHPELALDSMPTEPVFEPIVTETAEEAAAEEVVEEAAAEAEVEEAVEEAETEEVVEAAAAAAVVEAAAEDPETAEAVVEEVEAAEVEEAVAEEVAAAEVEEAVEEAEVEEAVVEAVEAAQYSDDDVIAEVGGKQITVGEFKDSAIFLRYQYLNYYDEYAMIYSMYGLGVDELNEEFESILGEENKVTLGGAVVENMVYDKIIEIEAEAAGITLTDEELESGMKDMTGYSSYVQDNSGNDSVELVDFDTYINSMLTDNFKGDISKDMITNYVKTNLIEDKLFNRELEGRTFEAEMVNARHILVEDEATAKEILEKLNAGEEWNALAAEYSMDTTNKDNGGALDWFPRGMMVQEFEDAAFAMEPGDISKEPVKTTFGYHIIALDGKEVRPLTDDALASAQNEVYTEWRQGLLGKYESKINEDIVAAVTPVYPAFVPYESESAEEDAAIENTEEVAELVIDNTEESDELTIDNTEEDESAYEISSAVENE